MKRESTINGRQIGVMHPPYVVAELSANHNGNLDTAIEAIKVAKNCGADAVKLQTYTPDTMTIDFEGDDFLIDQGPWKGYSLYNLYKQAYTPYEWHKPIFDAARQHNITCFSTPFDESAVDLLEDLNAPAYKIASFEATDLDLIAYAASTKKPLIISTGLANYSEIEELIETARANGCQELVLLHCISSYPAPIEQSNIATMDELRARYDVITGLSDHTIGNTASIVAVARGASFIEKHFTLSRKNKGPDSHFSIEPNELKALCEQAKEAWLSIGVASDELKESEKFNHRFRRSLYVVQDIEQGGVFTKENVRKIRPGFGIEPKYLRDIIGNTATRSVKRGERLTWDMVTKDY